MDQVKRYKRVVEVLSQCPEVVALDVPGEPQAETLAHTFMDLEDSFRRLLDDYFPRLLARSTDSRATFDLLIDIGEEFRHILYHVYDPKFYSYLPGADEDIFGA